MENNLDLAEQEELLLDWADDDGGQDPEILLAFWDSFPGFPSLEEMAILKRRAKEQFPISHAPPAKPLKKRKRVRHGSGRMLRESKKWTSRARRRLVLPPWEVVGIRKKSWQIGLTKITSNPS